MRNCLSLGGAHQGVDMISVGWARIDNREAPMTNNIAVGACKSERAGIVACHAPDIGGKLFGFAVSGGEIPVELEFCHIIFLLDARLAGWVRAFHHLLCMDDNTNLGNRSYPSPVVPRLYAKDQHS